jgi:hypothetical protein
MTKNLSAVYQFLKTGSGEFQAPRQENRSPGLAKIAPWWLIHRENYSAKAEGQVTGGLSHQRFLLKPAAVMLNNNQPD